MVSVARLELNGPGSPAETQKPAKSAASQSWLVIVMAVQVEPRAEHVSGWPSPAKWRLMTELLGTGRVMADSFRARGARVFISDVDTTALTACGHDGILADAADAGAMAGFVDTAVARLGGLDVLVNNAGIAGPPARVEDIAPEELDATLRINLAAMFHCACGAVPALREAGVGSIVNLSSAARRFGFARRSPYAAAKWGVIGFTKSLAIELGPDAIRVNAILPGLVEGPRVRSVIAEKAQ